MSYRIRSSFGVSMLAAGLLVACGASQHGSAVSGTGVTNAQAGAAKADSAVADQLASARCDREQKCNDIGPGQKYASRDVCMEQMRGNFGNELNPSDCPRGIDQGKLDQCMSAVRNEECGHPLDTASRMDKCRASQLCMK